MFQILVLPLIAVAITQTLKILIKSNGLKADWKSLMSYSGMPSSHASMVTSLATIVGLTEGWHSALFAVSTVYAILTIRDAVGVRRYLGQHGRILNILVKDLKDDQVLEQKYPVLTESIGHTPTQVLVGAIIGFTISMIGYFIL